MERIASKTVYEGPIASVRIDALPLRRRRDRRARGRRPPGRGRDRRPRRRAPSTWCASRARRSARPRLLELPAGKLDVEGETPLECAQRELAEEIGKLGERVERAEALLHLARVRRRGGHALPAPRASSRSSTSPTPRSGSRSSPGRSPSSTRAIDGVRDSKSLIGLLLLRDLLRVVDACTGRGAARGAEAAACHGDRGQPESSEEVRSRRRASRRWSSTSSPTWSSSAAWPATRSTPTGPTCCSSASSSRAASATRPTVERGDVADFLADLATGSPPTPTATAAGRRARRRRSAARPPACAPSTATCAARS